MRILEECEKKFGTVQLNGKKIILLQLPYMDYVLGTSEHYQVFGEDEDGGEYMIYWKILYHNVDREDACDWGVYKVIKTA